jgi:hypothetical protein
MEIIFRMGFLIILCIIFGLICNKISINLHIPNSNNIGWYILLTFIWILIIII